MIVRHGSRLSIRAIFAVPLLLAVTSAVGLAAGLLGDGPYDVVAATGIGLPVLAIGYHLVKSRR